MILLVIRKFDAKMVKNESDYAKDNTKLWTGNSKVKCVQFSQISSSTESLRLSWRQNL